MPDALKLMPPAGRSSEAAPSEAVVREAIVWWTRLQSGVADVQTRESCRARIGLLYRK